MLQFFVLLLPILGMANASLLPPETVQEIVVNNRILATVQGKTISVLDLMKKMDLFLNDHYPQYINSKAAKYQFYTTNWREVLNQMIDSELMMADAENLQIKVSDGEIRKEIQKRFGPNVMTALTQAGVTYEEARQMIHQEMVVEQMQWVRVRLKALRKVTPQDVKEGYKQFCATHPPKEEWKYQMLSIRGGSAELAQKALELLKENDLASAVEKLKAEIPPESTTSISLSQEYQVEDRALSQSHKEILATMKIGEVSQPIEQISRDGSVVFRLLHLKDHNVTETPKFEAVAQEIEDSLLQKANSEEMGAYVSKLRQRFGHGAKSLDIPKDFEPFTIR